MDSKLFNHNKDERQTKTKPDFHSVFFKLSRAKILENVTDKLKKNALKHSNSSNYILIESVFCGKKKTKAT